MCVTNERWGGATRNISKLRCSISMHTAACAAPTGVRRLAVVVPLCDGFANEVSCRIPRAKPKASPLHCTAGEFRGNGVIQRITKTPAHRAALLGYCPPPPCRHPTRVLHRRRCWAAEAPPTRRHPGGSTPAPSYCRTRIPLLLSLPPPPPFGALGADPAAAAAVAAAVAASKWRGRAHGRTRLGRGIRRGSVERRR